MAQHHLRHKADAELNLIPLIDILSVLVAFLLVYSTEVEVIQNSKGIEIPQSIAQAAPKESVVVMITKDRPVRAGRARRQRRRKSRPARTRSSGRCAMRSSDRCWWARK